MSNTSEHVELQEVYRNVYDTWRFEVDSYWERNSYFAAFEVAAIAGCWYVIEKHGGMGAILSSLGFASSLLWLWNNVAVHSYIEYWWHSAKTIESELSPEYRFATNHPGSGLTPSLGAKLVPVLFGVAWFALCGYALREAGILQGPGVSSQYGRSSTMHNFLSGSFAPEVFWVMATAVLTGLLVFVAWKQLADLARTTKSDFIYRLKKDFFTPQTQDFVFLLENDLVVFDGASSVPRFNTVERDGVKPEKDGFTTNTIDFVLLGPLEDVGVLWRLGRLSLQEVYEGFDYYVRLCVENKAIRDYIDFVRKDAEEDDIYDHLLLLYEKLREQAPKLKDRKRKTVS